MNQQKLHSAMFSLFFALLFSAFANAQNNVVPIIDMRVGGLLGGVKNGKYLSPETTVKTMKAEEDYTLYLFNGSVERVLKMKKPKRFCPDGFYNLDFSDRAEGFYDKGGTALGAGYKWNPVPRKTSPIALDNAKYKNIVADYLRTRGVSQPVVNITQAVRIDLEGDGQDEVLLTATRIVPFAERDQKKSYDEYSVVLLGKVIGGKAQTLFLTGDVVVKNPGDFNGSNSILSSILDLNGDGKMEIVVAQESGEGGGAEVFEMIRNKAVKIETLSASNGGECY